MKQQEVDCVLTYNGEAFDRRMLNARCEKLGIHYDYFNTGRMCNKYSLQINEAILRKLCDSSEFTVTMRGYYKAKKENFFVPVNTGKEFPYLDQLENAHLEYRNGVIGVCISD